MEGSRCSLLPVGPQDVNTGDAWLGLVPRKDIVLFGMSAILKPCMSRRGAPYLAAACGRSAESHEEGLVRGTQAVVLATYHGMTAQLAFKASVAVSLLYACAATPRAP